MNTSRGPCCTSGCTSVTTLGARIWATFSLWLWMRLHWEMKGSVAECRAGSAWCPNASSVCWGQLTQQHEYFISLSYTDQLELARQTLSCLCDFCWSHMSLLTPVPACVICISTFTSTESPPVLQGYRSAWRTTEQEQQAQSSFPLP